MELQVTDVGTWNNLAVKEKVIVFFDDLKDTINDHIRVAKELGFCVVIAKTQGELFQAMRALWDKAVFCVDMHVPHHYNMDEFGYEKISTRGCMAFATAIFTAFIKKYSLALRHAFILSALDVDEKSKTVISYLKGKKFDVGILDKSEQKLDEFRETLILVKNKILQEINLLDKSTQVINKKHDVASNIVDDWFDNDQQSKALVFGFREVPDYVSTIINNSNFTHDIEDRFNAIYRIKSNLLSIYNDEITREIRWLNAPNKLLDEKPPLDFLLSGHQHNLHRVISILERV